MSGKSTMIDDKARVVKGGSWKDLAYYLTPGTRRFLDENQQTDWLGFRCAMARVGSPTGINGGKKNKFRLIKKGLRSLFYLMSKR